MKSIKYLKNTSITSSYFTPESKKKCNFECGLQLHAYICLHFLFVCFLGTGFTSLFPPDWSVFEAAATDLDELRETVTS